MLLWRIRVIVLKVSVMTDSRDTRRRVKLYALNAERQWDDRGTGHVSSNYIDRLKGISLLVRAETDGKYFCKVILTNFEGRIDY